LTQTTFFATVTVEIVFFKTFFEKGGDGMDTITEEEVATLVRCSNSDRCVLAKVNDGLGKVLDDRDLAANHIWRDGIRCLECYDDDDYE